MQKVIFAIVYQSSYGHTAQAANLLQAALTTPHSEVNLINVTDAVKDWEQLHSADCIIFGCPTRFGNVSAAFKSFMEDSGKFWYQQLWKNKLAAGFTLSSSLCGDKLNTLQSLMIFAAQHSMHWVNLGVLPRFCNDVQTDGQNRLASYIGLTLQSDNSQTNVHAFHSGDLLTLELFAKRLLDVSFQFKNIKINHYDTLTN
jgi:multimeric flavodoxin WrbA